MCYNNWTVGMYFSNLHLMILNNISSTPNESSLSERRNAMETKYRTHLECYVEATRKGYSLSSKVTSVACILLTAGNFLPIFLKRMIV